MKKIYCLICDSIENLKVLKYHTFSKKHYLFLIFAVSAKTKMKRYRKKKNQLRYYI